MRLAKLSTTEAAILTRVIRPKHDGLSATAARALLKFDFPPDDRERMHELAVKNQHGTLSVLERKELIGYLRVGRLLDLIAAKARLSLKKRGHDASTHG